MVAGARNADIYDLGDVVISHALLQFTDDSGISLLLRTTLTDLGSLALVPAKRGRTSPSCVSALPGLAWEARRQLFKDILLGSGGASVGVRRDQRADIPAKPQVGEPRAQGTHEPQTRSGVAAGFMVNSHGLRC
jgi:hypothetical protein